MVYDPLTVRRYNLAIAKDDLEVLDSNPAAEEYVPCDVTTDYGSEKAKTYYGAGCRYKGALGSLLLCMDPDTRRETGGCRKLSFKVDANKFRDDKQKIDGLKKINFNGMAVDMALMSERIAYAAYEVNDIPAPRAAHSELFVNGVYDGLYTTVEAVDEKMTEHFFGDDANEGDGAVYKDMWIMKDAIDEIEKHHDSGKEEHKFMAEVINAIHTVSEPYAAAVLEKYFDTQSIVDVTALNTLLGQTDDWRLRHNFFWYVREGLDGTKKLVLIPWDFDRLNDGDSRDVRAALGNWYASAADQECTFLEQTPAQKAATHQPASQRQFQTEVFEQYPPRYGVPIQCDKAAQVFAVVLRDRVKQRIKEFNQEMPAAVLENKINFIARQIKDVVARDTDWPEIPQWQKAYQEFKTFLKTSRQQALEQANKYDPPARFAGRTTNAIKDTSTPMSVSNSYTQFSSPTASFNNFGTTSFGSSPSLSLASFGQSSFGTSPFTQSSLGGTSFGQTTSFGQSSFGGSSFGGSSFGGRFGR